MYNKEFLQDIALEKLELYDAYRADETKIVNELLRELSFDNNFLNKVKTQAYDLVQTVREQDQSKLAVDKFLIEYDLSSEEGIALMCMAEALLRIPDSITKDKLIKDKIVPMDWQRHAGKSTSTFVNAATWGLMFTGKLIHDKQPASYFANIWHKLVTRSGEPVVRTAVLAAMKFLSRQFVMGENIAAALKRAQPKIKQGYTYSFDMLGEEALTAEDANSYYAAYMQAIAAIGASNKNNDYTQGPGISVKLSALHPRYEWQQKSKAVPVLIAKVEHLLDLAKAQNINLTIDAEECARLELSLDIIVHIIAHYDFGAWQGFGLAVQAYQKRAMASLKLLIHKARQHAVRLMIRLVKGAYWDSEIKWAQAQGMRDYPVFTQKVNTDVSYLACAKLLFANTDIVFPQFATHNAYTVAAINELATTKAYEFQCLHGMGEALYAHLHKSGINVPCRIYAPVGTYKHLLAYLVRRLLENGANTSFVNQIVDENTSIDSLIQHPTVLAAKPVNKAHPKIPLPLAIYPNRANSPGLDFNNRLEYQPLLEYIAKATLEDYPLLQPITSEAVARKLETAKSIEHYWSFSDFASRARYLQELAKLLHLRQYSIIFLLVAEAGKTLNDAVAELREAIDFCNYYATINADEFAGQDLIGPTGERNTIRLHGRGAVLCISPWNFPLAIFLGQIVASLVSGSVVLAKPAAQTVRIAKFVVDLLHTVGVPPQAVQLVVASGGVVSDALVQNEAIKAVLFTGSTATAKHINRVLAQRTGPIVPFIAETGGQNCMLVDSSALPEQVIKDVVNSAFHSAGQRCSALRVLYIQEDVLETMLTMLTGAMQELVMGNPFELATDIGPVIDEVSFKKLVEHELFLEKYATRQIYKIANAPGNFFGPCAYQINDISLLKEEVFGPVLHIVSFKAQELEQAINAINATGYGLTLGIHSRINSTIEFICARARVGNIYVNRNMTGAVVGVQPFGGEGLSGTGPKAGGPNYVRRLGLERTVSVDTTAAGGNASLLML